MRWGHLKTFERAEQLRQCLGAAERGLKHPLDAIRSLAIQQHEQTDASGEVDAVEQILPLRILEAAAHALELGLNQRERRDRTERSGDLRLVLGKPGSDGQQTLLKVGRQPLQRCCLLRSFQVNWIGVAGHDLILTPVMADAGHVCYFASAIAADSREDVASYRGELKQQPSPLSRLAS